MELFKEIRRGDRTLDYKLPVNVKHNISEGGTLLSYVIGDCSALDAFLMKQSGILWVIPKYLNALFRGVGQVIFCNNPFSGFLVLFSLYWADLTVGIATTLSASTAILTAFVFVQDESKINAGLTTYNAVLVGSVTSSLWEPQYGEPISLKIWGFIILASILSVLVNAGLANLLGSFKPTLPSFTLAFNIVTILLFTCLMPRPTSSTGARANSYQSEEQLPIIKTISDENLHWVGIVQGILLSMGQVYAINNMVGSIIMYLSTLFYSPIVLVMSLVGATAGSLFGIVFASPNYDSVYNGVWGFNTILAAIAVGGFFFIPNGVSFGLALGDVALVVMIQQALTIALTPLKLPFLTFPFVLSSILFLEVTATRDKLHRVSKFSFPEMHVYEYLQSLRKMQSTNSSSSGTAKPMEKYDPSEVITLIPERNYQHHSQNPSAPPLQQLMYPELDKTAASNEYEYHDLRRTTNQNPNLLRQRTHQTNQFDANAHPHYISTQGPSFHEPPYYDYVNSYKTDFPNQNHQQAHNTFSPDYYQEKSRLQSHNSYHHQVRDTSRENPYPNQRQGSIGVQDYHTSFGSGKSFLGLQPPYYNEHAWERRTSD